VNFHLVAYISPHLAKKYFFFLCFFLPKNGLRPFFFLQLMDEHRSRGSSNHTGKHIIVIESCGFLCAQKQRACNRVFPSTNHRRGGREGRKRLKKATTFAPTTCAKKKKIGKYTTFTASGIGLTSIEFATLPHNSYNPSFPTQRAFREIQK